MVQKVADSVRARQSKRAGNEGPVVTLDSSVQALLAGLVEQAREQGTVSVADLLGQLLSIEGMAERRVYLDGTESDRANGFYERALSLGTMPTTIAVARTRSGDFRPSFLPPRYSRVLPGVSEETLVELLMAAKSASALKSALRNLGVSAPVDDIEAVQAAYAEELQLLNSSQLDTDYIALWLDGKYVKVRIDDRIIKAVVYVVIAMTTTGHKRLIYCKISAGSESKEAWRAVFQDLLRRGLRRVLTVIHDDLPGMSNLIKSLLPLADDQLCLVHVRRNIRRRMSSQDASKFNRHLMGIAQIADTPQDGQEKFDELCDDFEELYPQLIKELRAKSPALFSFLIYPDKIRNLFNSTNCVENFNSTLAKQIANNGGYYQSEKIATSLLGMRLVSLHQGKWAKPLNKVVPHLPFLNSLIFSRYEDQEVAP